jgi:sugar transferase (PEP-CTERM/EpsH1 system associated)
MRILYVTGVFPYPLIGGHLRHYHLIRELSRRHAITLISLVTEGFRPEHREAVAPFTEGVFTFSWPGAGQRPTLRMVKALRVLAGGGSVTRELQATVERLNSEKSFDVVVLVGKRMHWAAGRVAHIPVVADMCDTESSLVKARMSHAALRDRPWLRLRQAYVRRLERELIAKASHILFASCRDREQLLPGPDARATVVPNGVDLAYWTRSRVEPDAKTIVFSGVMDYPQNVDTALQLIEEILPRVRLAVPDCQLLIVGRDPTKRLRAAGERPGVTVTGFVDDVRPYLERAAIFAAPLRFAAGIQNKLLEAMAMEVPVIASPLAAEGLRTEGGHRPPIELASGPAEFAAEISRHLTRNADPRVVGAEGRRFVERHFSWRRSGEKLEEAVRAATAGYRSC